MTVWTVAIAATFLWNILTVKSATESLEDIIGGCESDINNLLQNDDLTGAQQMFVEDLLKSCLSDDGEEDHCTYDIGLLSGLSVTMDACDMMQLDNLQTKCQNAGATFCTASGTVDATATVWGVSAELPSVSVPVQVIGNCIGVCLPSECAPQVLEELSPFEFGIDFLTSGLAEELGSELNLDLEITNTYLKASIDCLEEGETVSTTIEEKDGVRKLLRL